MFSGPHTDSRLFLFRGPRGQTPICWQHHKHRKKRDFVCLSLSLSLNLYICLSTQWEKKKFPDRYILIKQQSRLLRINALIPGQQVKELSNSCTPPPFSPCKARQIFISWNELNHLEFGLGLINIKRQWRFNTYTHWGWCRGQMLVHITGTMLYNLIKSSIMGSIICADCYVTLKLLVGL